MPAGLGPLLWFGAIVALIPLALWLLKRSPLGGTAAQGHLRCVAVLPLSPQQRIVTVEVGRGGERRWLVLGVTPQGINRLHDMAPQDDAPAVATPSAPSSFAQVLGRLRHRDAAGDR